MPLIKHLNSTVEGIASEHGRRIDADVLFDLRESQREVRNLKDYIYGLKLLVALMAAFIAFWFALDVVFRAVGWFKSL